MAAIWRYQMLVTDFLSGQTIKQLLVGWLIPQRVRGALRIKKNYRVNGQEVPTSYNLQVNDILSLAFDESDFRTGVSHYAPNSEKAVDIVFENDDLVVVNKPAGMKMHPHSETEDDTLLNYVAANFLARSVLSAGVPAKPYMVHRIDRETSGAVIIAKNPVVVPILNRLLFEKNIQRTYLAWVDGNISSKTGVIDAPIGIDPQNNRKRLVDGIDAQSAKTHWTRVHVVYQHTLLRLQLDTGRMHQIRVHLASMGHPIVGDSLYASKVMKTRMLLHAVSVVIPLPFKNKTVVISCPVPNDFPRQLLST